MNECESRLADCLSDSKAQASCCITPEWPVTAQLSQHRAAQRQQLITVIMKEVLLLFLPPFHQHPHNQRREQMCLAAQLCDSIAISSFTWSLSFQ